MKPEYLYVLDFGDCTLNCLHLHNADKSPDDFESTYELLHGKDCPVCMKESKKEEDKQKYLNEFIKKSTIIHNGK